MLAPLVSASRVVAIKAKAEVVDLPLKPGTSYELAVTVDCWVRQRREDEKGDAEVGKAGSMFVPKGRVLILTGYHGAVLSVVREKADGLATLTPLSEV